VPVLPGTQKKIWERVLPDHGTTVPVLLFRGVDGAVTSTIGGSDRILEWAAHHPGGKWLFPNQESRNLARYFDEELGWFSRAWFMRFWSTGRSRERASFRMRPARRPGRP
jgi:hypothetical protein